MDRIAEIRLGEHSPFRFQRWLNQRFFLTTRNLFHINNLEEILLAVVNEFDAYTNVVVVACAVQGVKFRYNTSPRSTLKH
ncbi:MAG: hypothetical protein ACFNL1_07475 [Prevotella histicola]